MKLTREQHDAIATCPSNCEIVLRGDGSFVKRLYSPSMRFENDHEDIAPLEAHLKIQEEASIDHVKDHPFFLSIRDNNGILCHASILTDKNNKLLHDGGLIFITYEGEDFLRITAAKKHVKASVGDIMINYHDDVVILGKSEFDAKLSSGEYILYR